MKYTSAALAFLLASTASAQATPASGMAAWRQDLRVIAEQLPARHPNLFYRMSRQAWDSAVASLDQRLPTMTRNQALVGLMQLVALVSDGHTSVNALIDPRMNVHYYPFELFQFDDGLYVRSAAPELASLVGAKIIRLGNADAEKAIAAAGSTFGHENDWWVRAWAPTLLGVAEILEGLGLTPDANAVTLVVERNGKQSSVTVKPVGELRPNGHNPDGGFNRTGWAQMSSGPSAPLWLRNPGRLYWAEFVPGDSTLYVAYRAVVSMDDDPNPQFWRKVFRMADSLPVRRLVLDIRENTGGNSFFNREVVRGIVARPALDRPDRLFVIIGSRTFSAAMNLAQDLESWTNATFVGQPTGNATVFFGDHEQVTLPASGLTVNVSTLPWYPEHPRDRRPFIAPRLYAAMVSADYRANVDPAMRAILSAGTGPSFAERVQQSVLKGDSATALKIIADAAADPINRFRSPEVDVNALGYRLLTSDRAAAIAVFRLNVRAFPQSANAWDSLGEALVTNGQHAEGIAAYRKALELSPGFPSAVEALRRLGAPQHG